MKTIAVINLKGGVGKSITVDNVAYDLIHLDKSRRVLVCDLDKQANTTKFFNRIDYSRPSCAELMTVAVTASDVIRDTEFPGIDLIPANMNLLTANKLVLMDCTKPQQSRLKKALSSVSDQYDYCLMDCPPDLDMATINALVAADFVIIPVDCDEWALDGLQEIVKQVEDISEEQNPRLQVLGCLATKYTHSVYGTETVRQLLHTGYPCFTALTRYTVRIKEARSAHKPVQLFNPRCTAAVDYLNITKEMLKKLSTMDSGR